LSRSEPCSLLRAGLRLAVPFCEFSTYILYFFFSSRRRHTRSKRDWSSDVCSSDLTVFLDAREVLVDLMGIPDDRAPEGVLVLRCCRERQMIVDVNDILLEARLHALEESFSLDPERGPDRARSPLLQAFLVDPGLDARQI